MLPVKLTSRRDGVAIGSLTVNFMRTLRIPDDGRQHPLPPGLGTFPVRRVADYVDRVPSEWVRHGGVFIPMHEREAMWMSFSAPEEAPYALKVAVGMVNAVTGRPWSEALHRKQDYMVVPEQPWMDGIKTEDDSVRQFVAMPLGAGRTIEGQVTGSEQHGGLQLLAFPAKPGTIPAPARTTSRMAVACADIADASIDMGMAAGGRMRQKIYRDPYGLSVWDQQDGGRVFVHMCNAEQWQAVTGEPMPPLPYEVEDYDGVWFDLADDKVAAVPGSSILDAVKTVDETEAPKAAAGPEVVIVKPPGAATGGGHSIHDGDW